LAIMPEGETRKQDSSRPKDSETFVPTWLVPSKVELEGLKKQNERLERRIRKINEAVPEGLYDNIEELRRERKGLIEQAQEASEFTLEEVRPFLDRIQVQIREFAASEAKKQDQANEALSRMTGRRLAGVENKGPDEQRSEALELLEEIESNDDSVTGSLNALTTKELERFLSMEGVDEKLKAEVRARLRLQECYALVRAVGGEQEDMIRGYRGAVTLLEARGHLLLSEDFDLLLREGLPQLKIADALDLLQKYAFKEQEIGGEKVRYLGGKTSQEGKNALEGKVVSELGADRKAAKSLQLAIRLAHVTFETSVWNSDVVPVDPMAGAIYLRKEREQKFGKGTDRGPTVTMRLIDGFGTSFFRWASMLRTNSGGGERLFHSDRWERVAESEKDEDLKGSPEIYEEVLRLNRIQEGEDYEQFRLDFKSANYRHLSPRAYGQFLASYIPGILNAKDKLLKSDWKPDDFSRDTIMELLPWFDTHADKTRDLRLKVYFVLGALDEALLQGERLGWGNTEVGQVEDLLTSPVGLGEEGQPVAFLKREQWDYVASTLREWWRAFGNDFIMGSRGVQRVRR